MSVDETNDLQSALGGVVLEASYMERALRGAFAALLGSKYAPVADGRLTAHNLIEICEHIAEVHTEIGPEAKAQLGEALSACGAANTKRNRVIHDAWALRPGGIMVTLQTSRRSADVTVTVRTPAELRQVADELGRAADALTTAVTAALGLDAMRLEDQLRLELGHDITADPGGPTSLP